MIGPRYIPDDFDEVLPDVDAADDEPCADVGELVLRPHVDPPPEFQQQLKDRSFADEWNHEVERDSLSHYDMALARLATRAGWQPQAIADLLIAHRRKWHDPKDKVRTNPGYFNRTIGKALAAKSKPDDNKTPLGRTPLIVIDDDLRLVIDNPRQTAGGKLSVLLLVRRGVETWIACH